MNTLKIVIFLQEIFFGVIISLFIKIDPKIIKLNAEKEKLNVVYAQIIFPTYSKLLANRILELIELNGRYRDLDKIFPRISKFTDDRIASWYNISVAAIKIAFRKDLLKKMAPTKTIVSSHYLLKALRPKYSFLETNLTNKVLKLKKLICRDKLIEECCP